MRQMHLGVFVLGTGNHVAGWRHPEAARSFEDLAPMQQVARTAERGTFDLLFLGDTLNMDPGSHPSYACRFEPLTLLAALAATTTHLGLGATASTTYGEPWHIARMFASLDHLSGGRAAWNVVTSSGAASAANFGRTEHPSHEARYEKAEEFVDVVQGLWDCWEDGARVADAASGTYIDAARVHPLNHEGRFYKVRGPLNASRCPQGQPVIIQAGASGPGQELAARTADLVFSVTQDMAESRAFYRSLKGRMARYGRQPQELALLPGVMPIIGRTVREARDRLAELQGYLDEKNAMAMFSMRMGTDMSQYPMDEPVPDLPLPESSHGFALAMLAKARRENMTVRDLYNLTGAARGHWVLADTAEGIADTLQAWFESEACDGFNILPPWFPGCFDEFVDLVVPILRDRGLFRRAYAGPMLRDQLGLPRLARGVTPRRAVA